MISTRDAIYAALFAKLLDMGPRNDGGDDTFRVMSRRWKTWTDCPIQPALFQREQERERYVQAGRGLPPKVTLQAQLWIYTRAGDDPNILPSTSLSAILDRLDLLLKVDAFGYQTLGGIVSHAWIEGDLMKDPGDTDGQAVAIVPIWMLVP